MKKSKNNLFFLLKPYWKYGKMYSIVTIIISVAVTPLSSIANVLFFQEIINAVAADESFRNVLMIIFYYCIVLLAVIIINSAYESLYKERKMTEINQKVNLEIYQNVLKTDYKYFDDPEFYNNYTWAIKDYAGKAGEAFNLGIDILRSISIMIAMLSILLLMGPGIILITIVQMLIMTFFETRRNRLNIKKREKTLELDRKLNYVHRIFYQKEYAADLKSTNVKNYLLDMYRDNGKNKISVIKKFSGKLLIWKYAQGFLEIIYNAGIMGYIAYGLLISKQLTGMGSFMSLMAANGQLVGAFRVFFGFISQMNNLNLYADKIKMFFNTESKIESLSENSDDYINKSVQSPFALSLENIHFSYDNSAFVLRNINLMVKPGEKIAIVGENGVGKTTLVKLLLRLYEPTKGRILYDKIPIEKYDITTLRNKIGVAFQSTNIYALTLSNNLKLYGDISHELLEQIINNVGLSDIFIKSFGNLDTELTREFDKNGIILSGGQIQKIGIARIMSHQFGLVILDEPSSALDPIAEYELTKVIYAQANKSTTILIAHRLSMVRDADCIYVMNKGEICEKGTHDELMNAKNVYYEMFTKQSENYLEDTLPTNIL